MARSARIACAVLLSLLACGGGDDGGGGGSVADAGPGGGDGGTSTCDPEPSEVTCAGLEGSWVATRASNTPGTISHSGSLAITASGAIHIAFMDPPPDATTGENIFVVEREGCTFTPAEALTDDPYQSAYPSLVADGEVLHLVWNGRPDGGNNDIFYTIRGEAGAWAVAVNLTSAVEGGAGRHAYAPSLSLGPGGALAMAYLSGADLEPGIGPAEVRFAELDGAALAGEPITVIEATGAGCFDLQALHDAEGALHVVASCGPLFAGDIYWASNRAGAWRSEVVPGGEGHDDLTPRLALGSDGALHLVWTAAIPCASGTCNTLQYSRLGEAGWSEPVRASQPGTPDDSMPALAVTGDGTILIAFHRKDGGGKEEVFLTSSRDGVEFSPPCNLTRNPDAIEWNPGALQIHPVTGAPHLVWEHILPDSEPLNVEVVHAELVPP